MILVAPIPDQCNFTLTVDPPPWRCAIDEGNRLGRPGHVPLRPGNRTIRDTQTGDGGGAERVSPWNERGAAEWASLPVCDVLSALEFLGELRNSGSQRLFDALHKNEAHAGSDVLR